MIRIMPEQLKLKYIMIFSTIFIVLNTFFLANEIYWFTLFPVVALAVITAIFALDVLMFIIVFFTPLSVILQEGDWGLAVSLPTEPLLFCVLVIYIIRLFYEGKVDKRILLHPVTVSILFYLAWITFTCITSSMPSVSWKFLLSRLWLVIPFYFVSLHLFKEKKNKRKYIWFYIIPFSIVIIYTIINHSMDDFSEKAAHLSMVPFYSDHTSYGAIIAMYFPILLLFTFGSEYSTKMRFISAFFLLIFSGGLFFSYTRAAWLSILLAAVVLVIYLLRIRLYTVLAIIAVMASVFFYYQSDILIALESGKHKNIKNKNFEQRIQSITNVTTDASNTERFNRWSSALRMFNEKPLVGWGPGTYQFQYAPFQISSEKTIISTNFGDVGNAHSEYLGPLAETGILGLLSVLAIIITTLSTAGRIIYKSVNKRTRAFAIVIILGLITYFIHGTLNDFLDTDKASAPFWGFIAMLVMMDINEREINPLEN